MLRRQRSLARVYQLKAASDAAMSLPTDEVTLGFAVRWGLMLLNVHFCFALHVKEVQTISAAFFSLAS